MDLALNNLQVLICHKTQTNKQPIYTLLHRIKYSCLMQIIFKQTYLFIDGTLTGYTTPDQSGSNCKEELLYTPQSSRNASSPSNTV